MPTYTYSKQKPSPPTNTYSKQIASPPTNTYSKQIVSPSSFTYSKQVLTPLTHTYSKQKFTAEFLGFDNILLGMVSWGGLTNTNWDSSELENSKYNWEELG
tara:strand:+ start:873 stop:1175 length:303 start_codon:yes stop_codon:yes gene_type:complete